MANYTDSAMNTGKLVKRHVCGTDTQQTSSAQSQATLNYSPTTHRHEHKQTGKAHVPQTQSSSARSQATLNYSPTTHTDMNSNWYRNTTCGIDTSTVNTKLLTNYTH